MEKNIIKLEDKFILMKYVFIIEFKNQLSKNIHCLKKYKFILGFILE